jgi:hypothetical protein
MWDDPLLLSLLMAESDDNVLPTDVFSSLKNFGSSALLDRLVGFDGAGGGCSSDGEIALGLLAAAKTSSFVSSILSFPWSPYFWGQCYKTFHVRCYEF